jgi:membrane protein YqaA with SNARE-associated domain
MLILFFYAFVSNVALAVVPHEPVVIWYGARAGIWITAAVATAGTMVASLIDHRVFVPVLDRVSASRPLSSGLVAKMRRGFQRAPFAIIALSGMTPLPSWPFKAMAFVGGYPLGRYVAAVAVGRFPRYLILAWLGVMVDIPTWVLASVFGLLILVPLVRLIPWQRQKEN